MRELVAYLQKWSWQHTGKKLFLWYSGNDVISFVTHTGNNWSLRKNGSLLYTGNYMGELKRYVLVTMGVWDTLATNGNLWQMGNKVILWCLDNNGRFWCTGNNQSLCDLPGNKGSLAWELVTSLQLLGYTVQITLSTIPYIRYAQMHKGT